MKKRSTAAEKRHMGDIAELGCIICQSPAHVHHIGVKMGGGRNHKRVIPLCPYHHTGPQGIHHLGKKAWQDKYGDEEELLILTEKNLT